MARRPWAPYLDAGIVTVHDWPLSPGLTGAIDHCIEHHRHDSHWIAFIDVDEFVFAPDGASVRMFCATSSSHRAWASTATPSGPRAI